MASDALTYLIKYKSPFRSVVGLKLARRTHPDLIIIDMGKHGQEMDGEQMARTLKAIPKLAEVPILLISGICETTWNSEAFCDFVPLPNGEEQFITCVLRWFGD